MTALCVNCQKESAVKGSLLCPDCAWNQQTNLNTNPKDQNQEYELHKGNQPKKLIITEQTIGKEEEKEIK